MRDLEAIIVLAIDLIVIEPYCVITAPRFEQLFTNFDLQALVTSSVLQALVCEHCFTSLGMRAVLYEPWCTSRALRALVYEHCFTSLGIQAVLYKPWCTSSALQDLVYEYCFTSLGMRAVL